MAGHGPVNSVNPIWADHWTRGPRFEWNRKLQRTSPDTGFQSKAAPVQQPRSGPPRPPNNRDNAHPSRPADNSETLSDTGFSSSDDEKKAVFRHYTEKQDKKQREHTENSGAAFCNRRMSHANRDSEREHRSRHKTLSPEREANNGPDRDSWYRAWANAGSASAAQQVGKKNSQSRSHSCTSPEPAAPFPNPQPVNRQHHVPLKSVNEKTAFEFHDNRRKYNSPPKAGSNGEAPRHSPDGFQRADGIRNESDFSRAPLRNPPAESFAAAKAQAAPRADGMGQRSAEATAKRHEAAWQAAAAAGRPDPYHKARDIPPQQEEAAAEDEKDKWFEASAHFQPNYRRRNSTPSNNATNPLFSSCSSSGSTFSQRNNPADGRDATSPFRKNNNRQSPSPESQQRPTRPRSHTASDMRANRSANDAKKKNDSGVKVNTGVGQSSAQGSRPKAFDFKSHWAEVEKEVPEEKEDDKKNREKIYEWAKSRLERVRKGDNVPAPTLPRKNQNPQSAQWEKYDIAFTQFVQNAPSCIRMEDIPWPDDRKPNDMIQQYLKSIEKSESRKDLIRALSLRWHPDKFLQTFGQRLFPSDKDRIMQRVTVIFQLINAK